MAEFHRTIAGHWLGRRRYEPVLELQRRLFAARQQGKVGDTVLFVEHETVITLGRGTKPGHLLASREQLKTLGIEVCAIERGGDVTLHTPGQLVCYPILDLHPDRCDVRRYVSDLAESMRRVTGELGVDGGLVDGLVGLWVDPRRLEHFPGREDASSIAKIGAIGVRLSRWVTMHGYALNLSPDLRLFSLIVPCGISEHPVTSLESLTGKQPSVASMVPSAYRHFTEVFGATEAGFFDDTASELEALFPEAPSL